MAARKRVRTEDRKGGEAIVGMTKSFTFVQSATEQTEDASGAQQISDGINAVPKNALKYHCGGSEMALRGMRTSKVA